jgi:YARHG domain
MKRIILSIAFFVFLFSSCETAIKNKGAKLMIEDGTQIENSNKIETRKQLNSYVGEFLPEVSDSILDENTVSAGEYLLWRGGNKITITISKIQKDSIFGNSVVAGLQRNFAGKYVKTTEGLIINAKEPGNDKHDGIFAFTLTDSTIDGLWEAFGKLAINKRKYNLQKKTFAYNPNQLLDAELDAIGGNSFIDWTKPKISKDEKKKLKAKMSRQELAEFEEFDENMNFASATENIYNINASAKLLTEKDVANFHKGDLTIIRNTIYARHGYSFKYRPLRIFFDKQPWYIPVSTDVKSELTEIEKQNIKLLLRYEKNAKEYYDYFGRG